MQAIILHGNVNQNRKAANHPCASDLPTCPYAGYPERQSKLGTGRRRAPSLRLLYEFAGTLAAAMGHHYKRFRVKIPLRLPVSSHAPPRTTAKQPCLGCLFRPSPNCPCRKNMPSLQIPGDGNAKANNRQQIRQRPAAAAKIPHPVPRITPQVRQGHLPMNKPPVPGRGNPYGHSCHTGKSRKKS